MRTRTISVIGCILLSACSGRGEDVATKSKSDAQATSRNVGRPLSATNIAAGRAALAVTRKARGEAVPGGVVTQSQLDATRMLNTRARLRAGIEDDRESVR